MNTEYSYIKKSIDNYEINFRKNTGDIFTFREVYIDNSYKLYDNFNEEDIIIDLGSHIGSFSLLCHKLGSRRIHSYEYNKENYNILSLNVDKYGIKSNHRAVWKSTVNEDKFYVERDSFDLKNYLGANIEISKGNYLKVLTTSGYDALYNRDNTGEEIEKIGLDEIIKELLEKYNAKRIKILKLDIEGSEFPTLYTSELLDKVESIVMEVHEVGIRRDVEGIPIWRSKFQNIPNNFRDLKNQNFTSEALRDFLEKKEFTVFTTKIKDETESMLFAKNKC